MPKFILIALNGPTDGDGDEETYNRWYEEVHMPDLKAVEGIKAARRYRVIRGTVPGTEEVWPYAAVYEIEGDDLDEVMKGMGAMRPFDPTFDRSKSAHIMAVQISGDD